MIRTSASWLLALVVLTSCSPGRDSEDGGPAAETRISSGAYTERSELLAAQAAESREAYLQRIGLSATCKLSVGEGQEVTLAIITPGRFEMGLREDELKQLQEALRMRKDATAIDLWRIRQSVPAHTVTLTRPFYMAIHPVTRGQWAAVMGENTLAPLDGAPGPPPMTALLGPSDRLPVTEVTWSDAVQFCEKLSKMVNAKLRLPTEAEWEYACRAGRDGAIWEAELADCDEYAWHIYNYGFACYIAGVAQKKPNAWGLYDMRGNVYEWCKDWYGEYTEAVAVDPTGPAMGEDRVVRGAYYLARPQHCMSISRNPRPPDKVSRVIGFRVVLEVERAVQ